MSADEIEFAKTGVLSIQSTSALKQGLAKNNSFLKTTGGPGCDSLETNYTAGNGQSGVMFDIVAIQALTIEYFYSNLSVATSDMRLYYKTGTYDGFQADSSFWTFLGSANVTAAATNVPVYIPISINLTMNIGDTLAFYLTRVGTTVNSGTIRYTNGASVNSLYTSNSDLNFYEGIGVAAYPWGNNFTPRVWNGTIKYCVTPVGVQSVSENEREITSFFNSSSEQIELEVSDELIKNNPNLDFSITDIYGKVILNSKIAAGKNLFSTASLSKGVYIYSVTNSISKLKQSKLVVY